MTLTHDTCRCLGEQPRIHTCTRRESCARYTERNTGGPRAPFVRCLCPGQDDYFQHYIPIEMEPK